MTGYLRHKNLVQFQGWCSEGTETALVFVYFPNGCLSELHHMKLSWDSSEEFVVLSWKQRVSIILGVASFTYIYMNRDVKTCDIMLDAKFNTKLSDFWVS